MEPIQSYVPNSPDVIHETIENEAVIINLSTGYYYSLNETGTAIWIEIAHGSTIAEISSNLSGFYNVPEPEVYPVLHNFLLELQNDDLIVRSRSNAVRTGAARSTSFKSIMPQGAFITPRFERYTDMQSLLDLDPIHEVDNTGWPKQLLD